MPEFLMINLRLKIDIEYKIMEYRIIDSMLFLENTLIRSNLFYSPNY